MDSCKSTVLITWIFIFCVWIPKPGETLKCFVCHSSFNQSCDDLAGDRYLMDCSHIYGRQEENSTNCRKQVFSATSKEFKMDSTRTIRSCGYEKHPRNCFYSSNKDLKSTTCECTIDGCNGGQGLSAIGLTLLSAVMMAYSMTLLFT